MAPKKTKTAKKATRGGNHREMNPVTGFAIGTDQDIAALELLNGGSRSEIVARVEKQVGTTTRTGKPKPANVLVSRVLGNLRDAGFRVEESVTVLPPTPASKRKATAAKNSVAKKTTTKRATTKKATARKVKRNK